MKSMKLIVAVTVSIAMLAVGSLASATVIGGTSNAYNAAIGLSALGGLLNVGIGPVTYSSGNAPNPYADSAGISVDARAVVYSDVDSSLTGGLGVTLGAAADAGILQTTAGSTVNNTPGSKTAGADQSITNLDVGLRLTTIPTVTGLLGTLLGQPVVSLTDIIRADVIESNASVSGEYGAWTASGFTRIVDLFVFGKEIVLSGLVDASGHAVVDVDGYVAPNTKIDLSALGLANLTLTLNEQILGGNGTSRRSLEVNAIDLDINGHSLLSGVVNGDVIIGHSYAELWGEASPAPVPEPSTFVLIGSGLAGLFFLRRRTGKA